MAQTFIVKKRFENRVRNVVTYLAEDWNAKVAISFLLKLEKRMDAIVRNPMLGGALQAYKNLGSLSVTGHNRIFYPIEKTSLYL